MSVKRSVSVLLCLILVLSVFAGCSASMEADGNYKYEAPQETTSVSATISDVGNVTEEAPLPPGQKLIRTFHMDAETEDLDATLG